MIDSVEMDEVGTQARAGRQNQNQDQKRDDKQQRNDERDQASDRRRISRARASAVARNRDRRRRGELISSETTTGFYINDASGGISEQQFFSPDAFLERVVELLRVSNTPSIRKISTRSRSRLPRSVYCASAI
jgi:hypothetical protein